ncbi:MAG: class I SAM-dependent methyltransferase [Pseudomonadota bacterium]
MSRLEAFIRRMQAQKGCLDHAAREVGRRPGPVLELGLGNGRTYDHLRFLFPARAIYVFDREIAAHPDCVPPEALTRLGDFRKTLPAFLAEGHEPAVLIHADIGSADRAASMRLAAELAPTLARLLTVGGFLAGDQPMAAPGLEALALPGGIEDSRYHFYRRAA